MNTNFCNTRQQRAERILENNGVHVRNLAARTFDVDSERDPDCLYRVNLKKNSCTCKDAQDITDIYGNIVRAGHVCKHLIAATTFERRINESKNRPTPTTYAALLSKLAPTAEAVA